jgi:3,4-dihydroxyphenylacetate 2,3-dioxygenase
LVSGSVIGEAIACSGLKVLLLASGALSHRFNNIDWKPQHPRIFHEGNVAGEANIASDKNAIELLCQGSHSTVIERWDSDYRKLPWEAFGAHYLQMIGAMGGSKCASKSTALSDYETARGTGNIHIWFDAL